MIFRRLLLAVALVLAASWSTQAQTTYYFGQYPGFDDWDPYGGYGSHTFDYADLSVYFSAINHQAQTVTDCPVTKNGIMQLTLKDSTKALQSMRINFEKYGSDNKTLLLYYSLDSVNFINSGITVRTDTINYIEAALLPANTRAVKVDFSLTSKKIGIYSCTFTTTTLTNEPSLASTSETVPFGDVELGSDTVRKTITLVGQHLTEAAQVAITGADAAMFGADVTSLMPDANGNILYLLNLWYKPTTEAAHTALLTISNAATDTLLIPLSGAGVTVGIGGNGTEEAPYTCSDVLAMGNPADTAWVTGFIVGTVANGSNGKITGIKTTGFVNSNLALAPTASCTDLTQMIPIQLATGAVRDALNLVSNPTYLGREIQIQGPLVAYFTVPGVKPALAYKWLNNTAVDNIQESTSQVSTQGNKLILENAASQATVQVFTVTGQTIASFTINNGRNEYVLPHAGMYLVKIDNQTHKVTMK